MVAYLVAGLIFGDEGKGKIVDALTRQVGSNLIVRYNGGHQAAHNVVLPDGRHHAFHQFGSGMFVPGVRTYLSQYMLVSPPDVLREAYSLFTNGVTDALSRLLVHEDCLIVTPFQRSVNRLLEMSRGTRLHGSTGLGIWKTREDYLIHGAAVLKVGDLRNESLLREKLHFHRELAKDQTMNLQVPAIRRAMTELMVIHEADTIPWCLDRYQRFVSAVEIVSEMPMQYHNPIFEGAQGALLDESRGFEPPHTSGTNTTFENAQSILNECGYIDERHKIGVARTYFTRHGAGPFPSEVSHSIMFEPHNTTGDYAGSFRQGWFDLSLAVKSIGIVNGVDSIALNHLDVFMNSPMRVWHNGTSLWQQEQFIDLIESSLGAPVSIRGEGSTHLSTEFAMEKICQS